MTVFSASSPSFATRFQAIAAQFSPFCSGLDPSPQLLEAWGMDCTVDGLRRFCDHFLEAAIGHIGIVKPQVAFFEAFGPDGLKCLQNVIKLLDDEGLLVIADGKRNDIGSTMEAYARGWIGAASPFRAHAITATASMGLGALTPALARANSEGCGLFVVVRSSNPEGQSVQNAQLEGMALADWLADEITDFNASCLSNPCNSETDAQENLPNPCGPIGAVIGATLAQGEAGKAARATIERLSHSLFLVPGLGAQGGEMEALSTLFSGAKGRVIPTSSRSVLAQGPSIDALRAALHAHADQATHVLI